MNSNIRLYVTIVVVLTVIAAGIYMFAKSSRALLPNLSGTAGENGMSTSSPTNIGTSTVKGAMSTTVSAEVAAPKNYAKPLVFTADIPTDTRSAMQGEFQADLDQVKATNDVNAWSDIAVLRKITADYQAEADIWTYLTKRYPTLPGFYIELGDTYANYLKDYPKADANYLKAIALDPKNPDVYIDLAQLYRKYPKSNAAAENILKSGIAANPGVYQLNLELARLYVSQGRKADAKAQYDLAFAGANAAKQPQVAAEIQTEENAI